MLEDAIFMRYSRQLLLEEIGYQGQQKLTTSKVLIMGLGGLGSPAALYLAAAGVCKLWLADNDKLHISNLQRQILYHTQDISQPKTLLAAKEIMAECEAIRSIGYNNLLLVTGEHLSKVGMNYFRQYIPLIRKYFSSLLMEVQPLTIAEYTELKKIRLYLVFCDSS